MDLRKVKKINIITPTGADKEIYNVLTFEVNGIKNKSGTLNVNVLSDSKIGNVRRHISKLKLDKMI